MLRALLGFKETPQWTDSCNHPDGSYLFTFTCRGDEQIYDVYVWDSDIFGQEFCMRFGDADNDYLSPTGVPCLFASCNVYAPYRDLVELLQSEGFFIWKWKVED